MVANGVTSGGLFPCGTPLQGNWSVGHTEAADQVHEHGLVEKYRLGFDYVCETNTANGGNLVEVLYNFKVAFNHCKKCCL